MHPLLSLRTIWKILKQASLDFIEDKVFKLSAALAFYTIFSLPAMLIIIIAVSDIFYGRQAIEGTIYGQIAGFVGNDAAIQIQQTIRSAALSRQAGFATFVGLVTLIVGATSVFGEIQDSINSIWKLKPKPKRGWLKILINRLISFSMVVCLGFFLMVSLLINGLMDIVIHKLTELFPGLAVPAFYGFNLLLTFVITAFLFAIIFKFLPDAKIRWNQVRAGAFATALLFLMGKFLIGYYLGHSRLSSAYGAAGSVIVILLWVYYSAMILYFGAEFTRVYALQSGSRIYPDDYAVWVEQIEIEAKISLVERQEGKSGRSVEE